MSERDDLLKEYKDLVYTMHDIARRLPDAFPRVGDRAVLNVTVIEVNSWCYKCRIEPNGDMVTVYPGALLPPKEAI